MINFKKKIIVIKNENGEIEYLGADFVTIEEITKMKINVIDYKEVD